MIFAGSLANTARRHLSTKRFGFQHDGAPAHYTLDIRQHLNRTYGSKWIGRGGSTAWPPRSPDLTPLEFFLWGYMKNIIYTRPIETETELRLRIMEATETICNIPGVFERIR